MSEDLTGKKYGRLIVLNKEPNTKTQHNRWKCKCDCGNISIVSASSLKNQTTRSCGCLQKELIANRNLKHNMANTRVYRIWDGMKSRCYNSNSSGFLSYGGRGIKVCAEWLDKEKGFINFYEWSLKNGYNDDLTIDRIDVNGNYNPENCRWLSSKEQAYNRRSNRYITYNNETHTITEWAKIYRINSGTISSRIQSGWSIERAFTTPARKKRG